MQMAFRPRKPTSVARKLTHAALCILVVIHFGWVWWDIDRNNIYEPVSQIEELCNLDSLKESIHSTKFHGNPAVRDSASLKDIVALAKAELFLKDPYIHRNSFPRLLVNCENELLRSTSTTGIEESSPFYDAVIKQVYLQEFLELGVPEQITRALLRPATLTTQSPSATIVDVGANVGQFALPLAEEGHTVYSFEPVESTCRTLTNKIQKLQLQDRVKVHCVGVDEKEEVKTFGYIGTEEVKSASYQIINPNHPNAHVKTTVRTMPVQAVLDAKVLDSVHLFKTDTQGNEEAVIKGSSNLLNRLSRPRFLLVEYSYGLLTSAGTAPRKILQLLYQAGYLCTHLQFHHMTKPSPQFGYKTLDTPPFLCEGGVTATFDDLVRSVGPNHRSWALNGLPLPDDLQNKGGWTDLLCFA